MAFALTNSVPLPPLSFTSRTARSRSGRSKSASSGFFPTSSSFSRLSMSSSSPKAAALSMEFPYLPSVHRKLMSDLLSTMDARISPHLLPSDPLAFQNESGTSKGVVHALAGAPGSFLDFVMTSYLHCALPSGVLNITTVLAFLNPSVTSAPHLLLEFIQNSPTSLLLIMDLVPRKDLVLHSDYLHNFYEQTQLDAHRQSLASLPSVKPYVSPSFYVRSSLSPTAVAVTIGCEGEKEMEEVIWVRVGEVARGVVGTWLDRCCEGGGGEVEGGGAELENLRRRDEVIKSKTIEIDLMTNLPKLFGEEVAEKLVTAFSGVFGLQGTKQ